MTIGFSEHLNIRRKNTFGICKMQYVPIFYYPFVKNLQLNTEGCTFDSNATSWGKNTFLILQFGISETH